MDISADGYPPEVNRPGSYSAVRHSLPGIVRRLVEWFTLTDAVRTKAGINVRRRET